MPQAKMNQQNKNKRTLNNKGNKFSPERVQIICFVFGTFCAREIFSLKKINRLEIVLTTSFYYTTTDLFIGNPLIMFFTVSTVTGVKEKLFEILMFFYFYNTIVM